MIGLASQRGGASLLIFHSSASLLASGDSLVFCPVKANVERSLSQALTRTPPFNIRAIQTASPIDLQRESKPPNLSISDFLKKVAQLAEAR